MSIIAWLVLGLISGFIASKLVNHRGSGVIRRGRGLAIAIKAVISPTTSVLTKPNDETVLPHSIRSEVVLILAGMLLHGCQEARR